MSENPLLDLEPIADQPLPPSVAVSALAMNFALKWHDMRLIKDGTLYQQKKMEGANIQLIDMADVLRTAQQFEAWLLAGQNRHSQMLRDGVIKQFIGTALDILEEASKDLPEDDDTPEEGDAPDKSA